jgi:hypothetical protein
MFGEVRKIVGSASTGLDSIFLHGRNSKSFFFGFVLGYEKNRASTREPGHVMNHTGNEKGFFMSRTPIRNCHQPKILHNFITSSSNHHIITPLDQQ